jgi:hypothetical protein
MRINKAQMPRLASDRHSLKVQPGRIHRLKKEAAGMMFKRAYALALFTVIAGPALAADEPPVIQAILKNWETQYKIKPSYKSITGDASNATIEGLEATAPAGGLAASRSARSNSPMSPIKATGFMRSAPPPSAISR